MIRCARRATKPCVVRRVLIRRALALASKRETRNPRGRLGRRQKHHASETYRPDRQGLQCLGSVWALQQQSRDQEHLPKNHARAGKAGPDRFFCPSILFLVSFVFVLYLCTSTVRGLPAESHGTEQHC